MCVDNGHLESCCLELSSLKLCFLNEIKLKKYVTIGAHVTMMMANAFLPILLPSHTLWYLLGCMHGQVDCKKSSIDLMLICIQLSTIDLRMLMCEEHIPKSNFYGEFVIKLAPTSVRRGDVTDDSLYQNVCDSWAQCNFQLKGCRLQKQTSQNRLKDRNVHHTKTDETD